MGLKEFFKELDEQVQSVNSSSFDVEIIDTNFVPTFSDPNITYDNLDTNKKKCKRLESCVLYVDIRNSVKMSAERQPKTLAKVYSSFVRSMLACARYYGGHVRNIIGDRVMVVFDKENCFTNAVNTAILMNSVCQHILNKRIWTFEFSAGIGIDYGKMLITKSGAIRHGDEKEFYRSLVWLGKPANIASRLTDLANKKESNTENVVRQGYRYPWMSELEFVNVSIDEFLDNLEETYSPNLIHKDKNFKCFFTTTQTKTKKHSPILMTKEVFDGYKRENPTAKSVKEGWFSKKNIIVRDYSGDVYGGDVIKTVVEEI